MRNEERTADPGGQASRDTGPAFQVVAGHPTHEEVAALAAALTIKRAAAARQAAPARRPASGWADRRRQLRIAPAPGPGAWRRSAGPR